MAQHPFLIRLYLRHLRERVGHLARSSQGSGEFLAGEQDVQVVHAQHSFLIG